MAELLDELRPRVYAIAYRMLGSVSDLFAPPSPGPSSET